MNIFPGVYKYLIQNENTFLISMSISNTKQIGEYFSGPLSIFGRTREHCLINSNISNILVTKIFFLRHEKCLDIRKNSLMQKNMV
jgi:hypothetical protein